MNTIVDDLPRGLFQGLSRGLFYGLLCLSLFAPVAADLKPSQEKKLSRELERIEQAAEVIEAPNPSYEKRAAKKRGKALKKAGKNLAKAEKGLNKLLKKIKQGHPDIDAGLARIANLRPKLAQQQQALVDAKKMAADAQAQQKAALKERMNSPQTTKDVARMKALMEQFQTGWYYLDETAGIYSIRNDEVMQVLLPTLKNAEALVAEAEQLKATYEPFSRTREARVFVIALKDMSSHQKKFQQALPTFVADFPARQQRAVDALNKELDDIIKKSNGYRFDDDTSSLWKFRTRVEVQPEVYAAAGGSAVAKVNALRDEALARFDKVNAEGHGHH